METCQLFTTDSTLLAACRGESTEEYWMLHSAVTKTTFPVGDVPSRDDFELPPKPEELERPSQKFQKGTPEYKQYGEEIRKYSEAMGKYNRIKQKNYVSDPERYPFEMETSHTHPFHCISVGPSITSLFS